MKRRVILALVAGLLAASHAAVAQQPERPVSRADAVAAAATHGPRLAIARADTAAAAAQLQTARAWQNPTLSATYSKATPQYHYVFELPLDLPYQRRPRVGAATASQRAAQYRFAWEQAAVQMEADTTYTRALAARAIAELSARSGHDADSLRRMAVTRRDAGDASDMDVALATVSAGQAANQATTDSLAFLSAVLDLQSVMGMSASSIEITLTDSLAGVPAVPGDVASSQPLLPIAAASAQLEAATLITTLERRSVFGVPSLVAGVETGDPSGGEPGRLPTFGVALPLPLFNRNRGPIAMAQAAEARARAELTFAEVQSRTELARAQREWRAASAKVERDKKLVEQADRVAGMALTAYREGAASIPNVLEAQRVARELLAEYIRDVADAWIAGAELKVLTLTAAPLAP
jgi:cobalt-zinc-cadmium efflux system outer membrane protein